MLREFQESMFSGLPARLKMMKESLEAAPISEADVPPELMQRFIGKSGRILLQVAAKNEIFEREPLQEFVTQVKSVFPNATGEPVMVYESLTVLRDSYLKAFGYAFIGIACILMINDPHLTLTVDHQVCGVKIAMAEHGCEPFQFLCKFAKLRGKTCFVGR